ncbi:hypothetical protein P775_27540 [Puniceibacterium antarcticum]|uniref:Uncharacterized protein n=1 Tax=Puniceibacterium antarcticum TaxID=1206336 RepID=A0A2G8QWT4_9RHOB|nr:hypothetical protein [Puniceibacterium antarcticum]PIL13720.1 hypothetical protein P775_27540 [Puniceibacterium antarcticum]
MENPYLDNALRYLRQTLAGLRCAFSLKLPAPNALHPEADTRKLSIAICERTPQEQAMEYHFAQGQFLARQERWDDLALMLRSLDHQRATTPGGTPVAEVLAQAARADAVDCARAAVQQGDVQGALAPLAALEEVLADHPGDHTVGLVVAMAHIDVGWVWRGKALSEEMPPERRAAFYAHFRSASQIIDQFDPFAQQSPAVAAARCALLPAEPRPSSRVADDYEDLIDLDPQCARHMRDLGRHLLPRWYGSYARLDLEARRTTARTHDIWGGGAYVWVYLDTLASDPGTLEHLDGALFAEGLHDILERRPDQHTVNLLAASLAFIQSRRSPLGGTLARVAACFDCVVRDHLREVHPMVWANVPPLDTLQPFASSPEPLARGKARAMAVLSGLFAEDIRKNRDIRFDPDGLHITG